MIRKGIIEAIISPTEYRVRMPDVNGVGGSMYADPMASLPDCVCCISQGISPNYQLGDIVWIAYEYDEYPVIIGKLFLNDDEQGFPSGEFSNLTTHGNLNINGINGDEIESLKNIDFNIKEKIDNIENKIVNDGIGVSEYIKYEKTQPSDKPYPFLEDAFKVCVLKESDDFDPTTNAKEGWLYIITEN